MDEREEIEKDSHTYLKLLNLLTFPGVTQKTTTAHNIHIALACEQLRDLIPSVSARLTFPHLIHADRGCDVCISMARMLFFLSFLSILLDKEALWLVVNPL